MMTLYSTDCPKCKVLEARLTKNGFDFAVSHNIDTVIEAGYETAPVLEKDGKFMSFAESMRWLKSVEKKEG